MPSLRILLVALTIVATSLSGAVAAGHGDWTGEAGRDIVLSADAPLHAICCDEVPEQSSGCHVLPVIEPRDAPAAPCRAESRASPSRAPRLMAGLAPSGLLDPPRGA